jgi:hypothetical protein
MCIVWFSTSEAHKWSGGHRRSRVVAAAGATIAQQALPIPFNQKVQKVLILLELLAHVRAQGVAAQPLRA